jgi:glycerol-3-phosphate O-acyltransferase
MGEAVVLPFWVFVILSGLAGWAALVLLLVPGMRWFFRRRIKLVLHQIGGRLRIELPSFKLTRRQVLIDRLFHDHKVQAAAAAHAVVSNETLGDVWKRIDRYAREIVPSFNAYIYYRVGYALARAVARALYRVRIGFVDEAALARIDPRSTIVFVINHRSNMDYVLVAFLAAEHATLSFAVGEWARIWPLQQLIRAMGAYFVRRNSGDPLYRTVLARYVQMASEAGVTQAVFPEGGLTMDGRLRAPKFGLLDYMLKTFDEREAGDRRDLVFIPVGLNYDRVLEDRSQLLKLHPDAPRPGRLRGLAITGFLFPQSHPDSRGWLASLRLCLRQFRYAVLDARPCTRARRAFPALEDVHTSRRGGCRRRAADGCHRPRHSGAAGVAGRQHPGA